MANRKLDMGMAWSDATGMIGKNRELVGVLAGIFLFIPMFVLVLALARSGIDLGGAGADPDPELIAAQINALLLANWWALALAIVGQHCAAITILALLGDSSRPTVNEVLRLVPRLILPVFAAQLITGLLIQVLPMLLGWLPDNVAAVGNLVVLPVTLYLTVKLWLVTANIVINRNHNPLTAIRDSWRLTKGSSLRLLGFFILLAVVAVIIGLILMLIVGLLLAAAGERVEMIGNAAFVALLLTMFYTVSFALMASIHRQLSEPALSRTAELFE